MLAMSAGSAHGAPLQPVGPVDICGSVVSREWLPERAETYRTGRPSSLKEDRKLPAGFRVVLENVRGIDAAISRRINSMLGFPAEEARETPDGPRRVLLLLTHAEPRVLDGAASLCVQGFQAGGDESGSWTRYVNLSVTR